jgi:uncharacterized membrane protein YhiD involved in acid resistance
MFAISVIGSLASAGTLSMTVIAVAFQSITPSALDRLTDNINIPNRSKRKRFITTSTEEVIESLNQNLRINVETALTRDNQQFAVLLRVIALIGRER